MNEQPTKRTWLEAIYDLQRDYTLSIRDVCRILKASRSWVNRYIRPHVDAIYLNSGKRGDFSVGPNWVRMAAKALDREDMTESTWLHKGQLYGLLERAVVSVTKQTKGVPLVYLMDPAVREQYIKERDVLIRRAELAKSDEEFAKIEAAFAALPAKFIDKEGQDLAEARCSITKRGDVERIEVAYPGEFNPEIWVAAHDIKDYGDTDEDVYRRLFRGGYIRIELAIPDADGVIGQKIFYIPDPEPIQDEWDDRVLIVPETAWLKYRTAKGL